MTVVFQWIMYFFIYCLVGWIYESTYVSIRTRKLTNRGFMRGPFLPIYGCGAVIMAWVGTRFGGNPVTLFFGGMICATTMEFFTGAAMEKLFKVRYWDYSKVPFNYKGHICLGASLAWGAFTLILNYFIHPPVQRFVSGIDLYVLETADMILMMYFTADFSLSFKTALDLRDVIIVMDKFKKEIELMEKRLDVIAAVTEDTRQQTREKIRLRLEERIDSLEQKMEKTKAMIISPETEAEIAEFKLKGELIRTRLRENAKRRGAMYRNMIRNNPMLSSRFADALQEIRDRVDEHYKNGK
ncbi:MAG: hypothetical protein K6G69_07815 [Lachnospiraceae bacterium]|nr:hypothetical protein [Lachnospiraceae bacterium]